MLRAENHSSAHLASRLVRLDVRKVEDELRLVAPNDLKVAVDPLSDVIVYRDLQVSRGAHDSVLHLVVVAHQLLVPSRFDQLSLCRCCQFCPDSGRQWDTSNCTIPGP